MAEDHGDVRWQVEKAVRTGAGEVFQGDGRVVLGEDKDTGETGEVEERGEQELEARERACRRGLEEVVW